jgi:pimeloyl-ACP methyl ester carboxylesterase
MVMRHLLAHRRCPLSGLLVVAILFCAGVLLSGCSTNGQRIDQLAAQAGLQKNRVMAGPYSLVVYEKRPVPTNIRRSRLLVYIEGDGLPWGGSGMRPAADPTTGNPLALRMMLSVPGPSIYVSRPCYQEADVHCTAEDWTGGRYAQRIVDSMSGAIAKESRRLGFDEIVLVGYSGGGALAVLIGEQLPQATGVITIGANLDVAAWATHHGYLPLATSLNPALSQRPHSWPEFHFAGATDQVVPTATVDPYFRRYPRARRTLIDHADHVCCWEDDWPALLAEVLGQIDSE